MKQQKLSTIADIVSGYNFRTRIHVDATSDLYVLQSKDITEDLTVDDEVLTSIIDEKFRTSAFLKESDVVLSSRGSFRAAVAITRKRVIVASSVYILRAKDQSLLSEYLALYLNSQRGQTQMQKSSTSVVINTVPIAQLKEIVIPIPSITVQKELVSLYQNNQELAIKLQKKAEIIHAITDSLINSL